MRLNNSTAAWMAGFIDGEGCITVNSQIRKETGYRYFRPIFAIYNTCRKPLEIIQRYFGGKIGIVPAKGNKRKQYLLRYSQVVARKLVKRVLPYLVVKKQVAEAMLAFPSRNHQRIFDAKQFALQEKAILKIRKLNKRGNK